MPRRETTAVARIDPNALEIEFADNPQPRCPCVLILDASSSMAGVAIDQLNAALDAFASDVKTDTLAAQRVEVAIVQFATGAEVLQDFVTADDFEPPRLHADGLTAMGMGLRLALDILEDRKAAYRSNGVSYFRPWVFLLTDGQPQGEPPMITQDAFARVREEEKLGKINFFAIGTGDANLALLSSITGRRPLTVETTKFRDMFVWLSRSVQRVSNSQEGQQIELPDLNWTTIKV